MPFRCGMPFSSRECHRNLLRTLRLLIEDRRVRTLASSQPSYAKGAIMDILDRRTLIAAAAACGATAAAAAKNSNEPLIGAKGAPITGPRNVEREQQNPDILRPPSTDHGSIPNLRF